jgi:hypothetical protein
MFSLSDGNLYCIVTWDVMEAAGWNDERFNPITCKFLAVGPAVPGQRRSALLDSESNGP